MVTEVTLRHDLEHTLQTRMVQVRCVGTYAKTKRTCNRMLAWLDGTARLTCPRCGTTLLYSASHGPVRVHQP
jgi:predicted RNA-binding Zn-ribbon protein involved in translation (DUF1610 family)